MVDRQFLAAREVAATHRRLAPPSLARVPDTRSPRPCSVRAWKIFAGPESALADSGLAQCAARRPLLGPRHPPHRRQLPIDHLRPLRRGPSLFSVALLLEESEVARWALEASEPPGRAPPPLEPASAVERGGDGRRADEPAQQERPDAASFLAAFHTSD